MTTNLKWISVLLIVGLIYSGISYVINISNDLEIAKQNNIELKKAIQEQQVLLDKREAQINDIKKSNNRLSSTVENQRKQIRKLNDTFNIKANGQSRDFGKISRAKPKIIARIINSATKDVNKCFEIITKKNVTKEELINECKEIADSFSASD